jgi:hypothetical protein
LSKYDPLRDYLKQQKQDELILTFEQIEDILGFGLPRSAQRAEWWGDDTPEHPREQRAAFRDGGYDARRMSDGQSVRFRRMGLRPFRR